ncbi:hypothetical protein B0H14DRAFT_3084018 [Mycena olivaceomarginata]|nr:hypothetical protein B0H14DRAFT_3084018 [Mycena olivaceomarginata]
MDRLEALGTTLSQMTMYDIKSMYNQAKNVVLNVSEIEAKVREATNDEPWGASSTLMQDIANRPDFNEIMPSIYARFMEKEARQWRQIYKALQLLEYLVKNGSERVVDDARSHISTIKMLRNFHYIDEKGKDEGLNVRNRSRELVELLSDVEKIRAERRKAKANKHKYTGTGNDGGMGGMSFASESGGRYGGFGNDSLGYGGGSGGGSGSGACIRVCLRLPNMRADRLNADYYNGGGSSSGGGGSSGGFRDERRPGGFDEYNAGDDEIGVGGGRTASPVTTRAPPVRKSTVPTPAPPPPPPAAPVNLFDTDDDDFGAPAPAPPINKPFAPAPAPKPAAPVDDDFDDFQAAPVSPGVAAPLSFGAPVTAAKPSLHDMLNKGAATPPAFAPQPPRTGSGFGGAPMGMGMGAPIQPASAGGHRFGGSISSPPLQPQTQAQAPNYTGMGMGSMAPLTAQSGAGKAGTPAPASKPAASFDDLWSMSLGSGSKPATPNPGPGATGGKSIKDLEREKATAGLWGSGARSGSGGAGAFGQPKPAAMGSGLGMGMGGMSGGGGQISSSSGLDDLLG